MADNTTLNAGTGGDTIRDVDRAGVKTGIVGLDLNPAGAESLMAGAMPVNGTFWQATQPVSIASAVTVNAGTNLNTSALALESGGHLAAVDGKLPALGQALAAGSVPVVLTAAQLTTLTPLSTVALNNFPASFLSVQSGTWTVTGAGGTFPVTGTFWQATQPVSIAAAVATTQSGTWTNTVTQTTAANLNCTAVLAAGSAVIGHVIVDSGTITTVSTVTAVTAITNALPAGTNLIGQVSASHETGTVYSGTTALTPKFATFSTASSGATTVVALVGGKRIRVLRWRCTSNGATNVKWQSHVSPTDISGLSYLTQFGAAGGAYCPVGHFQTISGEALDINNSATIAISGEVTYVEV